MKALLTVLSADTTTRVTAKIPVIDNGEPRYQHVANVIRSYAVTLHNEQYCISYEGIGEIHNLPAQGDARVKVMVVNQETCDTLIDGSRESPDLVKAMLASDHLHILDCGVPETKVKAVLPNG